MYYFIVNPGSSSGKGLRIWKRVEEKLKEENQPYSVLLTKERRHAAMLAKKLSCKKAPCTIVAVGGDGTANEVIGGLKNFAQIRFGYIPTGSGNDLARGLSLPSSPEAALRAILHPCEIRLLRVGVNRTDCCNRFIVSTGIGFDAAVCHEAQRSAVKKVLNRLGAGKLTYLFLALKQLVLLRPGSLTITADGGAPRRFDRVFFAAAMNLKYEGGGFMFCPEADPTDDYLDLCIVEQMSKLKVLCLLPTAFKGRHTRYKGIHIMRCRACSVLASDPLAVHTDGEPRGMHAALQISLLEEKLPFIVR